VKFFNVEKKMKQKQRQLLLILSAGAALILSGCATPISVKHVDIQTAYRIHTESALSSGEPSDASSTVLRRHGQLDRFETEPAVVLAELHKSLKPVDDDQLFALAELSCCTLSVPMTAPIFWHRPCMPGHSCFRGMARVCSYSHRIKVSANL
jgi:hypothetical protein